MRYMNVMRKFVSGVKRRPFSRMPVWESLACVAALRLWTQPSQRLCIHRKGDSLGVCRAMVRMASRSPMVNRVIQTLALDLAADRYIIDTISHSMGITNELPDQVSRMQGPSPGQLPLPVKALPEC
eukprot:408666-Amphidinium_carterae.1